MIINKSSPEILSIKSRIYHFSQMNSLGWLLSVGSTFIFAVRQLSMTPVPGRFPTQLFSFGRQNLPMTLLRCDRNNPVFQKDQRRLVND